MPPEQVPTQDRRRVSRLLKAIADASSSRQIAEIKIDPTQADGRGLFLGDPILPPQALGSPATQNYRARQISPRKLTAQEQRVLNRRLLVKLRDKQKGGLSPREAIQALELIRDEARAERSVPRALPAPVPGFPARLLQVMRTKSPAELQQIVAKRHGFNLDELERISTNISGVIRARAAK